MIAEPRRSSRTNKGTHTGRDMDEVYYQPEEEERSVKKQKTEPINEEGQVRCDFCGTTDANYNEDTDEGGIMIECEQCRTWQHAKCMGFAAKREIPQKYLCNRCEPEEEPEEEHEEEPEEEPEHIIKPTRVEKREPARKPVRPAPKERLVKTRESVLKAVQNVLAKASLPAEDVGRVAGQVEEAIYLWSGTADKKYIDKSRSVMALVKKPAVLARLTAGEVSALDLALLLPEEIDPELRDYAEKVRQELIRRSVLTVNDELSQRIRRTHKGEEIVESVLVDNDFDSGLMARNIDHRKFDLRSPEDSPRSPGSGSSSAPEPPKGIARAEAPAPLYLLDDDDDEVARQSSSESDDDLDLILKDRKTEPEAKKPTPERKNSASEVRLPPTMPVEFWSGDVVFPDFASFHLLASFTACTHYETPRDNTTAAFHNRAIRVCKELLERPTYYVEGRLDRGRADPYLAKITSSRDLYLVRLDNVHHDKGYDKMFDYFLTNAKVGVLSNRAPVVKDAYVFALDGVAPSYLDFPVSRSLYALFVVKKDYIPVGKSILKKAVLPPQQPVTSAANLDSILSKLGGASSQIRQPQPQLHPLLLPPVPVLLPQVPLLLPQIPQMPLPADVSSELSADQMSYLSELVYQNPHVQNNPLALLNLLQSMQK